MIERLITVLNLDQRSRVLDLGCGTGQLAIPLAERTRTVLGVDIEPDMLRLARRAAQAAGAPNVNWVLGADSDLGALVPLLGEHVLDAVTIGQALHWMNPRQLFATLRQLVRPGGSVAVVANGTPLWMQSTSWSAALRAHLEAWLGTQLTSWCGTDPGARQKYRRALVAAGFDQVIDTDLRYSDDLTFEQVVGSVYSAMSPDQLPHGDEREKFEQQLRKTLVVGSAAEAFREHVTVTILAGKCG